MEGFILWCGFVGAWLLFAGPIYQAALELQEQDLEMDRIRAAGAKVQPPPEISNWWWLLPPVKWWLEHRRSDMYRRQYIQALSSDDVKSLMNFMNKATGWLFVAIGGFCIAMKESYELAEHNEWSHPVFGVLVVVMGLLSILHLLMRVRGTKRILNRR
jgi:hypothetical protein